MTTIGNSSSMVLQCANQIVESAGSLWDYKKCFSVPESRLRPPEIKEAADLQHAADIGNHRFFEVARRDRSVLRMWVSQEAIVTGTFSQLCLLVASQMRNVHQRAAILEVAVGEHGPVSGDRIAKFAHPWLLHQLCESVGLTPEDVQPLPPTVAFLRVLADSTINVLRALGAFGVGNELMLIPEYTALRKCFETCYPEAAFSRFFDANIEEDAEHVRLVELLAESLIATGENPREYVEGARAGVLARVRYYDEILNYVGRNLL